MKVNVFIILLVFSFSLVSAALADTVSTTVTIQGGTLVSAVVAWVTPQGRIGDVSTNSDVTFYLTVRTADDNDDVILFTQSSLATTNADGSYSIPIDLTDISPGTYDIGIKGHQHLTKVLDNVTLSAGQNTLNFTQTDNSASRGSEVLIAGDINGNGSTPATLGDDVINSVDLSTMLGEFEDDDATGNSVRTNLNQDVIVNSVDLGLLIDNLDEEGDN